MINISEKGAPSRKSLFGEWRKKCINLFSAQATTISGKTLRLISYWGGWGKNSRIRKRLLYHLNRVDDELSYDVMVVIMVVIGLKCFVLRKVKISLVLNCNILIVSLGKGEIWDNLWGRKSLSPKCGQFVKTGFYSRSPMMMPIVGIDKIKTRAKPNTMTITKSDDDGTDDGTDPQFIEKKSPLF